MKKYLRTNHRDKLFLLTLLLGMAGMMNLHAQSVPTGAINGLFSVSENTAVFFSQGNLQYIGSASTPYWKFADNQWDCLGVSTGQNSTSQNSDRDLFGWGTSGYNHGAYCYQPWSTGTMDGSYYAYGNYSYSLFDQTGQADWGYNAISNGGNQENSGWHTLTAEEWRYLFDYRFTQTGDRYAKAQVNGINGVILLPDEWSESYYSFSNTNKSSASFNTNVITAAQWNGLEQHGAVFLPAAGYRHGTSANNVGTYGYYWSADRQDSYYDPDYVPEPEESLPSQGFGFSNSYLSDYTTEERHKGLSVRLVCYVDPLWVGAYPEPWDGGEVYGEGEYVYGSNCTLTAVANDGYIFECWYDGYRDCVVSTDAEYTFRVGRNIDLEARFNPIHSIHIEKEPSEGGVVFGDGYLDSSGDIYYYVDASTCTLTAVANEGYFFDYWFDMNTNEAVSADAEYTFVVTEDRSLKAVFGIAEGIASITASAQPANGGIVAGEGDHGIGYTCTLTAIANEGYYFVNWTDDGEVVSGEAEYTFVVKGDRTLVANFASQGSIPTGAINGLFSVGENASVYFSQGNLQFIGSASVPYWKFADNQWDYLGDNGQESNSETVDRDLFGWGTSGYNHGAVCYQPWSTTRNSSDYYAYGNEDSNLDDQTGQADWGYNAISNGGNRENNGWRTLSREEWDYLFNTRSTSSGISYVFAQVNGINGVILLPDDWNAIYYPLNSTIEGEEAAAFTTNIISASKWSVLERHGAVFLPAATLGDDSDDGEYWTSTHGSNNGYGWSSCFIRFYEGSVDFGENYRFVHYPVRLVCSLQPVYSINVLSIPAEGGEVEGGGTYYYGETVTLTATPFEGFVFWGWMEDGEVVSTDATYTFTVTCDRNLAANFIQAYDIVIISNPEEGGEVEGDGTYYFGETASLTAIAFEGYTFVNWTENGEEVSNDANYSFVVTDDRTLVANFSHNSHNISASAYPAEEGMVYGDGVYYYGEECTLTAIANEGFVFINWTEDGVVVSNDADYYFIVEGDRSLVANFALYNTHVVHLYGGTEGSITTFSGQTDYYPNENVIIVSDALCMRVTGITVYKTGDYNVVVPTDFDASTGEYSFLMPAFDVDVYANSWSANEYNVSCQLHSTNSWNYSYFEGPEIAECGSEVSVTLRNNGVGFVLTNLSAEVHGHHNIPITINSSNSYITHFSFTMPDGNVIVNGTLDSICLGQLPDVCQYQAPGYVDFYLTGDYIYQDDYSYYCLVREPGDYHWEYYYYYYDNGQMFDQPGTWEYCVVIINRYGTFYSETKSFEVYPATLYTIDANPNPADGGEVSGTGIYPVGEECPFTECTLTAYTNEGYTFENWTENGTVVSSDATYSFTVSRNRTLLANFIPNSYEITASAYPEEGGTVSGGGTFNYGETVSLSAIANEDYVFLNWTENGNVVSTDANYSFTVTGDRTLVANFAVSYEITISSNPPEGGFVTGGGSYYYGEECTLTATANDYYFFVNWTENGEEVSTEADYSFIVEGDRTLEANFTNFFEVSYEITITSNPPEGGLVIGGGSYYYGEECTLTATANEGYSFLYWSENGEEVSTEADYYFIVEGDRTLEANFFAVSYDIAVTFNPSEGGLVTGGGSYYYGEECTLTATANEGYVFLYWSENGKVISKDAEYSFEVVEDRNLEVRFAEEGSVCNLVFFLYDSWGDGWNGNKLVVSRGDETSEEITLGSGSSGEQTLAVVNSDHITLSWIKGGFIGECSFIVSYSNGYIICRGENLNEDFSNEFDVDCEGMPGSSFVIVASAEPTEGGTVSGAGSYGYNANCTLTATANEGYTFMYWTENGTFVTSEAEYSFIVNGDRELVANFTLPFTITVEANPMEGGTVAGAGSYDYGSTCTLSAIPDEGYDFLYWSENGTVISVDAEYSFEVTEDKNMEAHFAEEGSICNLVFSLHDSYGDGWTGNKLVVTHRDETSDEITLDSGSSGDQIFFVLNGDHITLAWINGDYPEDCSFTVSYSNGNVICRGANLTSDFSYEFDVDCEEMPETVFVVTASAEPLDGGSVTGAGTYYPGDVCTLTATANAGYVFIYWTKDGSVVSSSPSLSFEVTGPATYVANFMSFQFNVSATVTPEGAGVVSGTGIYSLGTTCTLTATANEGYAFVNWTLNGTVVGTEPQYSFAVSSAVTLVANFERTTVTQQVTLSTGWNWFSSYIEGGDPVALLDMLKEALDDNAVEIQSYDDNTECMDGEWFGGLDDVGIDNAQTYMILAVNDCTIELEGPATDPANYPITLYRGWNWIGFPCAQEVSVADAFAGFEPEEGDVLQSYDNMTEFDGEDWWGELETLVPGQGLMYYSMSDEPKELVFQTGSGRAGRTDGTVSGHAYTPHFKVFAEGCSGLNTTMSGVLTVNGLEQRNGALEIGVFDQYGICRAAKLPMYRSKTDQWIYQLQIKGMEGAEYTFRVFDHESGRELDLVPDMETVVYNTNTPYGSLDDPYLFAFVSTTGVGEDVEVVNLYPNPADKEERVRMELPSSMVPVGAKVEVYDALGKLIVTSTVNGSDVELEGMKVSGLYTVKVTDCKGNVCYGKLVVK